MNERQKIQNGEELAENEWERHNETQARDQYTHRVSTKTLWRDEKKRDHIRETEQEKEKNIAQRLPNEIVIRETILGLPIPNNWH